MMRTKHIPLDIPTFGTHRGAITDGSRGFQPTTHRVSFSPGRSATIDGSRGFQPTVTVTNLFRRGATIDGVATHGEAPGFMRRSATRFIAGGVVRGLKPTATVMRSRRDEETITGRGATIDGSRAFQRPDYHVPYLLRHGATADRNRGFQPTEYNASHQMRRVATLDVSGLRIKSRN